MNKVKHLVYLASLFVNMTLYAQDLSGLFDRLDPSVVTVEVLENKVHNQELRASGGLGSGVIVSKDGLIITADHVVESANEVSVKLQDGISFLADVISSSTAADVALLKLRITPSNLKPATLGQSSTSKIGEQILIIGAPRGLEHSLSVGYISRKMKNNVISNGEMAGYIQTDASINQGNSGGPMFNSKGEIILSMQGISCSAPHDLGNKKNRSNISGKGSGCCRSFEKRGSLKTSNFVLETKQFLST